MKNSVSRYLKNDVFNKGYFEAPVSDLMNFKYGKDFCPICKQAKFKFITPPFGDCSIICLDCLLTTNVKFSHDSEYGIVTLENLPPELLEDIGDVKNHVSEKCINDLLLTPEFSNIQGGRWLGHCNDFMVFKGIWEPVDFTEKSEDKNGKKLFLEMTSKEQAHLWDECELNDNETEYSWEDIQYYTFECRHCGKLRGYWE